MSTHPNVIRMCEKLATSTNKSKARVGEASTNVSDVRDLDTGDMVHDLIADKDAMGDLIAAQEIHINNLTLLLRANGLYSPQAGFVGSNHGEELSAVMAVIDRVRTYPDAEPEARARRVIAHLVNDALIAKKRKAGRHFTVEDLVSFYSRTQGDTLRGKPYSYLLSRALEMISELSPQTPSGAAYTNAVELADALQ